MGRRLRSLALSFPTAALTGGCFWMTVAWVTGGAGPQRLGAFVLGMLFGAVVVTLVRLFPVARWAYPLAGSIVGPLPVVLFPPGETAGERGGFWVVLALVGAVIGTMEWARAARREAREQRT